MPMVVTISRKPSVTEAVVFIERNWGLGPLTKRSRDNFPNPKYNPNVSLYAPTNSPAIGDLFDLFDFGGGDN